MILNVVQYKQVDVSDFIDQYAINEIDLIKVGEPWKDDKVRPCEIKTENLDVIKFFNSSGFAKAVCIPKEIDKEMKWFINILNNQLKKAERDNFSLKRRLREINEMNFWQSLKFVFTKRKK